MDKLCVDCKYHKLVKEFNDTICNHVCTHYRHTKLDLVTGEQTFANCYDARKIDQVKCTGCAPLGKLWEPIEK